MLYYKHDSSGELKAEYAYNAWGEIISATGTMAEINPIRYRGYYYDAETGFYYCKSRYYDPEICRFISPDSSYSTGQDFAGNNAFVYCGNNPVSRADDEGEFWHIVAGAVIGAVVNVAVSYTFNKLAGNDYSFADGVMDAAAGAISGGLAASGVGKVGQMIANGLISGISTARSSYLASFQSEDEEKRGKVNWAETIFSTVIGGATGYYGDSGLTANPKVSKQIKIIGSNLHSIFRKSSQNTIKRSWSYISFAADQTFRKFVVGPMINNTHSAIYNAYLPAIK